MLRKERADIVWRLFGILERESFLRDKQVAENRKNLGGSETNVEERKGRYCVVIFWNSGEGKLSKGQTGG